LFDQSATKIGIDESAFSARHGIAQCPIADPLALCEAGKFLRPKDSQPPASH
jgi:hypothetical protein